ncbi:hypothetical protein [Virgisporangium aurantiacum]|uniref:Uncharacterized protein n=1 Tax=Virgisporangium aurantiacum TaxID=175570 RepID=A0A8J4EA48_9ACTN|nr:hypothetical protein [Virgisporangium aurantiacum]GIJ64392.1 hypothetical protein Vau01_119080 [Virgisporangium aurantiacum]
MKVTMLREELERLEQQGRGDCRLYVFPTRQLQDVSHRPGHGTIVGFDDGDFPIEAVDESFTQPEDAEIIFLEFGMSDQETG